MARRVVLASQKGGVGKTTVALNLGVALAERRRRTLLVDLDPQGGLGLSLAKGDTELAGLAELLMGKVDPTQALLATHLTDLWLLPRGRLDPVDVASYESEVSGLGVLGAALEQVEDGIDVVIIDPPSGMGMITRAALAVADFALLPFQTETLALRSLGQTLRVLDHVRSHENPKLRLLGILPTMVDRESAESMAVLGQIWQGFPDTLETIVPRSEVFARASHEGVPVAFLGGPSTPEARRFELLAQEIETRLGLDQERSHEAKAPRKLL